MVTKKVNNKKTFKTNFFFNLRNSMCPRNNQEIFKKFKTTTELKKKKMKEVIDSWTLVREDMNVFSK